MTVIFEFDVEMSNWPKRRTARIEARNEEEAEKKMYDWLRQQEILKQVSFVD